MSSRKRCDEFAAWGLSMLAGSLTVIGFQVAGMLDAPKLLGTFIGFPCGLAVFVLTHRDESAQAAQPWMRRTALVIALGGFFGAFPFSPKGAAGYFVGLTIALACAGAGAAWAAARRVNER